MSKEFYDPERAEAAADLWDKLRSFEGEDNDAQLVIERAMSEYACTADKRIEDSEWAQKYKGACIEIGRQAEEIEQLRAALAKLADAEDASIEKFGAREISNIEQAMAHARHVLANPVK